MVIRFFTGCGGSYLIGTPLRLFPGDMLYADGYDTLTRLPIGQDGYVVTSDGSFPSWQPSSGDGVLKLTTAERIALGTPDDGTLVFDLDLGKLMSYFSGSWSEV